MSTEKSFYAHPTAVIDEGCTIGSGTKVWHFCHIMPNCVIGENCNISQGITIGVSNYGDKKGTPTIGNRVFIGPNACVFGNITVGNNVTIGANAVVTDSIPDGKTVLPSKTIILDKDLSPFYIHDYTN